MSIQLKVPSLGESITQATIGAWLKKEGEPVQADEPLVEVESEKATVALPAPGGRRAPQGAAQSGETVDDGRGDRRARGGRRRRRRVASPLGSGPLPGGAVPAARGDGRARAAASRRRRPPRGARAAAGRAAERRRRRAGADAAAGRSARRRRRGG